MRRRFHFDESNSEHVVPFCSRSLSMVAARLLRRPLPQRKQISREMTRPEICKFPTVSHNHRNPGVSTKGPRMKINRLFAPPPNSGTANLALLVLRVWLGIAMLLIHGWDKAMHFNNMKHDFPA